MTEELSRTSALASRHRALGSGLEDWNGMGTAWTYNTNLDDEHDAVRENAGLFDLIQVYFNARALDLTEYHQVQF